MAASNHCSYFVRTLQGIILILGIVLMILMVINRRPYTINSRITHALLTHFNFNPNHTLHYNLVLNITLQNPNTYHRVHYDSIELLAYYKNQRFGCDMGPMANLMNSFYQDHQNTTLLLTPTFKGQQLVILGDEDLSQFKAASNYDIVVKLSVRNNYFISPRTKLITSWEEAKSEITCELNVPLITTTYNNTEDQQSAATTTFETAECKELYTSLRVPFFLSICFLSYYVIGSSFWNLS